MAFNKSQELFQNLLNSMVDGIFLHTGGVILESNDALSEIFGYKPDELRSMSENHFLNFISDESTELVKQKIELGEQEPYSAIGPYEVVGKKKDGSKVYLEITSKPLEYNNGNSHLVTVRDVTERKKMVESLQVEHNKLNALMEGMGDLVVIIDKDCNITFANSKMKQVFGVDSIGKKCHEVISGLESMCSDCIMSQEGGKSHLEIEADNFGIYMANHTLINDAGGENSAILVLTDITYNRTMEEELKHLAITDKLTGLYNKGHFMSKIKEEMVRAERQNLKLSLLFADLDKFKSFNDTYGHVEGDTCLAEIGKIISDTMRSYIDTGFRYGGEEFAVILPGVSAKEAVKVGERIRKTFKSHTFTPTVDGKKVEVNKTISIGAVQYDGKMAIKEFIEIADKAMYSAKRAGGDSVVCV